VAGRHSDLSRWNESLHVHGQSPNRGVSSIRYRTYKQYQGTLSPVMRRCGNSKAGYPQRLEESLEVLFLSWRRKISAFIQLVPRQTLSPLALSRTVIQGNSCPLTGPLRQVVIVPSALHPPSCLKMYRRSLCLTTTLA